MAERFERFLMPTDTCTLWTGTTDGRYGLLGVDGGMEKAHRVAWMLADGPIPDGLCVLHTCDVTLCVRRSHLFLGTYADNAHDRDAKGRHVRLSGERSGMAKLTDAAVRDIRSSALPTGDLATRYGVTYQAVSYVRKGDTWRHVA